MIEITKRMLMNINGTEKITKSHLNDSPPPINIINAGWITSIKAKNNLRFLEGSFLKFFMAAVARIYDEESYVVHKNIIDINPNIII